MRGFLDVHGSIEKLSHLAERSLLKRIGRQIVAQRDTQWENLAVLSAYARILPCQVLLLTARIGHTLGNFCSTSHQHEL